MAIRQGAQGVHLHSVKHALAAVRNTLGTGEIIGVSVRDAREAAQAAALGAEG